MGDTKITVMAHQRLNADFNKQIRNLHLKRDAFLAAMIIGEIEHLAADLSGKKLSMLAKRFIAGELKRSGTKAVNLSIPRATARALNAVVEEHNIVRDAFINRLILFLRSTDSLLKYLDLPRVASGRSFSSSVEEMPTSPMGVMEDVQSDPLFYLRTAVQERYGCGLYSLQLPPKLTGFECYLDDDQVPNESTLTTDQPRFLVLL